MRARAHALLLLLLVLGLTAFPSAALGAAPPATTVRQPPPMVQARLGISAGDVIQSVERGTDRRALERIIPELFETAMQLGVRIDDVSVGRGFWQEDDGEVESENDLDLVVSGMLENVYALGATMGQRWGQSAVLVWTPLPSPDSMMTVTLALPGGTAGLDETVFTALAKELTDGGHIKYAGARSLIYVAHTGDDSDEQFQARMARARSVLLAAGVQVANPIYVPASMVALNRANYQQFIDGAVRGKAA